MCVFARRTSAVSDINSLTHERNAFVHTTDKRPLDPKEEARKKAHEAAAAREHAAEEARRLKELAERKKLAASKSAAGRVQASRAPTSPTRPTRIQRPHGTRHYDCARRRPQCGAVCCCGACDAMRCHQRPCNAAHP